MESRSRQYVLILSVSIFFLSPTRARTEIFYKRFTLLFVDALPTKAHFGKSNRNAVLD